MERQTKNAEQRFLELIAGPPTSVSARLIRSALRVLSWGYRSGVAVRNLMFDVGLKRSYAAPMPVISVGNLTTGGTGKTPTVALLVDLLKESGHQPGIISRGYRELSEGGNDEARVLELLCPGTPHIQNRDRVAASRKIEADHPCTVILADDAFQHRRLMRDLDIVLIDALNPWGHGALLPRGLLREPVSALRRADMVILTRSDLIDEPARENIWQVVRMHNETVATVELAFEPAGLIDKTGTALEIDEALAGCQPADNSASDTQVLAFCGIGNPDGFQKTLSTAGIKVHDLITFPDHHHYDRNDLQELISTAETASAIALVTTVKDLVKIEAEWAGNFPLFALGIRARVTRNQEMLAKALSGIRPPQTH